MAYAELSPILVILLLCCFTSTFTEASSGPSFVEEPEPVFVRSNPVFLKCKTEQALSAWFECNHGDAKSVQSKQSGHNYVDPQTGIRIIELQLEITRKDVEAYMARLSSEETSNDSGALTAPDLRYQCWCNAYVGHQTIRSRKAQVSFSRLEVSKPQPQQLPPRIIEHPPKYIVVNKGDSVTLACNVKGKPAPLIEWHRNGQRLRSTDYHVILPAGSIFFPRVSGSDSGIYWCTGRNDLGQVKSHQCLLEVGPLGSDGSNKQLAPTPQQDPRLPEPQQHLLWQPWFIILEVLTLLFVTSAILVFLMRQLANNEGDKQADATTGVISSKPADGQFLYRTFGGGDGHVYENKLNQLETSATDTDSCFVDVIYEEVSSLDRSGTRLATFHQRADNRQMSQENNQHREQQESFYAVSSL